MGEYEAIAFLTDASYESRLEGIKILHSELKANKNKATFSDNFEISRALSVAIFDKEMDVRIHALCFVGDFISGFQGNEDNCIHTLIPALLHCLEDSRPGVQLNAIKLLKKCLVKSVNFQGSLEKIIVEGIYSKSKKRSLASINKIHFIVEDYRGSKSLARLIQALFNQLNNKHLQTGVFNALKNLSKGVDEALFQQWCQNIPQDAIKTYHFMKKTGRQPSATSTHQAKNDDSSRDIRDYDITPSSEPILLFGFLPQSLCDKLSSNHLKEDAFQEVKKLLEANRNQASFIHHLPDFVDFLMRTFDVSSAQINSSCSGILHHLITHYHAHLKSTIHTLITGLMPFICSKIPQLKDNIYKLVVAVFQHISATDSYSVLLQYFCSEKVKLRQEAINVVIILLLSTPLDHSTLLQWLPGLFENLLDSNRFVRQAALECCALIVNLVGSDNRMVVKTLETLEERQGGRGVRETLMTRVAMARLPRYNSNDGCVEYASISGCAPVLEWVLLAGVNERVLRTSSGADEEKARDFDNHHFTKKSFNSRNSSEKNGFLHDKDVDELGATIGAMQGLTASISSSSLPKMENSTKHQKSNKVRKSLDHLPVHNNNNNNNNNNHISPSSSQSSSSNHHISNEVIASHYEDGGGGGGDRGRGYGDEGDGARMVGRMVEMLDRKPQWRVGRNEEMARQQPLKVDYNNNLLIEKETGDRTAKDKRIESLMNKKNKNSNYNNNYNNNNNKNNIENDDVTDIKSFVNMKHSYSSNKITNIFENDFTYNNTNENSHNNNSNSPPPPNAPYQCWDETVVGGRKGGSYGPVEDGDADVDYSSYHEVRSQGSSTTTNHSIPSLPSSNHHIHPTTNQPLGHSNQSNKNLNDQTFNPQPSKKNQVVSHSKSNNSYPNNNKTSNNQSHNNFSNNNLKINNNNNNNYDHDDEHLTDLLPDSYLAHPSKHASLLKDPYSRSRRISVVHIEMADNLSLANNKTLMENEQLSKGTGKLTRNSSLLKGQSSSKQQGNLGALNITDVIQTLNSDNWKAEVASLDRLAQVCKDDPQLILPHLQPLTQAVVNEVRNLRSNVSRSAIRCLTELFRHLKQAMEPVVEKTMMELLCRVGQPSNFMKEEATKCMQEVVANISPNKSLQVLINHGSMSKNVPIKNISSQLIFSLCERLGAHEILCVSPKEFTGKILNKTAQYLVDGSPEVRANGRRILLLLRPHQEFDKCLRHHLSHELITRNVDPVLRNMQSRGDVENLTSFSAHQRTSPYRNNSGKHTRYHSAGNLCEVAASNYNVNNNNNSSSSSIPPMAATHPITKSKKPPPAQRFTRVDGGTMESIEKVLADLGASDYRVRWSGVDLLSHLILTENKTTAVAVHINKIFDKLVPCLKDRNFKVKVHALETLNNLLMPLSPHLNTVINMTVAAVTTNLASNQKEVHQNAVAVLDTCAKVLDPGVLLSSMVTSTINANVRYKVEMIDRVSDLVSQVTPQRYKIISLLVLPLLWQLLSSCAGTSGLSSPVYKATCRLANEIKLILGDGLMDAACINSKVTLSMRECLASLLE